MFADQTQLHGLPTSPIRRHLDARFILVAGSADPCGFILKMNRSIELSQRRLLLPAHAFDHFPCGWITAPLSTGRPGFTIPAFS